VPVLAAAVSNHEQEECILRLELLLEGDESLLDFGLSGLLIDQDNHSIGRKAKLLEESLLGLRCPFRELCLMFRAAGHTSENESARLGKGGAGKRQNAEDQDRETNEICRRSL